MFVKIFNPTCKQQGFTLVEALATIVIMSLVILLLIGILSNGQKQFSKQNEKNRELQNISYAFKIITKEIRQHPNDIVAGANDLTINGIHYHLNGTNFMRDSVIVAPNIQQFQVTELDGTISLLFISTTDETYSTQIVKRK